VKILADVNVSRRVVERLRERGFSVVRVSDVVDPRSRDADLISLARTMQAVLVSHDQDMSAILALSSASQPSLINLRVTRVDVDVLSATLETVLTQARDELVAGAVITVEDDSMRIRPLPIR
jgi:predicted nuclease of predicted toxin-antitoxin system